MDTDDTLYLPPDGVARGERCTSAYGVDLTQIRRLLALTPSERLRELEEFLADLDALRLLRGRCSSGES